MSDAKTKVAQDIINLLADVEGLTVREAAEIIKSCHSLISENTIKAIAEQEERPLSEALSHLSRSKIKVVQSIN